MTTKIAVGLLVLIALSIVASIIVFEMNVPEGLR